MDAGAHVLPVVAERPWAAQPLPNNQVQPLRSPNRPQAAIAEPASDDPFPFVDSPPHSCVIALATEQAQRDLLLANLSCARRCDARPALACWWLATVAGFVTLVQRFRGAGCGSRLMGCGEAGNLAASLTAAFV